MFNGIITAIGCIQKVEPIKNQNTSGLRLQIEVPVHFSLDDVALGASIAINGACMTVIAKEHTHFNVEISQESLRCTVGLDKPGLFVNLEKAMRLDQRLDGHFVLGHVDAIAEVIEITPVAESVCLKVAIPKSLACYMAKKGSVTLQGVALTINEINDQTEVCIISVNIIPHTWQHTTLQDLKTDERLNVEIDPLARYVERLLTMRS